LDKDSPTDAMVLCLATMALALAAKDMPCPPTLHPQHCLSNGQISNSSRLPLQDALEYVRALLQSAVEVEHSTIPPYLSAMYSIRNASSFAASTIRNVIIEEMLHMTAAANVLNAVGGAPSIDHPDFIPQYPSTLPMIGVNTSIRPLDQKAVRTFMLIERPPFTEKSISDVYEYIVKVLTNLVANHGEAAVFSGDPALQVVANAPSIGENVSAILGLADATSALLGVAHQGGGCPVPGRPSQDTNTSAGELGGGLAHFARFTEILEGRLFGPNDTAESGPRGPAVPPSWDDVYQFAPNPRVHDFPVGPARELTLSFAGNYTALLVALHDVFNGHPNRLGSTLGKMYALRGMATAGMRTPDPRHGSPTGYGIGPTWEYVPAASRYGERLALGASV